MIPRPKALQRTAAPQGDRAVRVICQQLLQPTGRLRRRSLSLDVRCAEGVDGDAAG